MQTAIYTRLFHNISVYKQETLTLKMSQRTNLMVFLSLNLGWEETDDLKSLFLQVACWDSCRYLVSDFNYGNYGITYAVTKTFEFAGQTQKILRRIWNEKFDGKRNEIDWMKWSVFFRKLLRWFYYINS